MELTHILYNPFENDSRVLKELESLSQSGLFNKIYLLCTKSDKLNSNQVICENVYIHRLGTLKPHSNSFWLKIFDFLMWVLAVLRYLEHNKPSVLHCHDLTGLIAGGLYKIRHNVSLIYDCHEFQSEIKGLNYVKRYLIKLVENIFIRFVDRFITVSESIGLNYSHLFGINDVTLVLNCPKSVVISNPEPLKKKYNLSHEETLYLYQGNLSKGRGINLILQVFEALQGSMHHILFMGYGPLQSEIELASKTNPNIHFHPAVSPEILLNYTAGADVGICLTDKSCKNHLYCLPNKFFEYINAGLPVVCNDLYEIRKIHNERDFGALLESEDSKSLIELIGKFNKDKRFNVNKLAEKYNWSHQESNLLKMYQSLKLS